MAAALKFRRRVKFMRRQQVDDGAGNRVGGWDSLCGPFWARLRPLNGREEVLAQKLSGVSPYELQVRFCRETLGVTTDDMAIDDQGVSYDITAISNPDEQRRYIYLTVTAGKAVG